MSKSNSHKASALRVRCYVDPLPILEKKCNQIKRAIFICHDRDNVQKHYHLNILLKSSRQPEEIRRWFVTDEDNAWCDYDSGTFESAIQYYKHETDEAIAENKYHYSDEDICYFQCSADDLADIESDDCSFAIVRDMLAGVPLLQIVQKYGKNFTRYYLSFRAIYSDIRDESLRRRECSEQSPDNRFRMEFDE